ncbi:hypothetical protein SP41_70 [Salmonella phage 41]|nr:hypothetical protein SP41_70 [Salmonella phage 41]
MDRQQEIAVVVWRSTLSTDDGQVEAERIDNQSCIKITVSQ